MVRKTWPVLELPLQMDANLSLIVLIKCVLVKKVIRNKGLILKRFLQLKLLDIVRPWAQTFIWFLKKRKA